MPPKSGKNNLKVSTSSGTGSRPSSNVLKIRTFTLDDVESMTENFDPVNLCGQGQYAFVYKGTWYTETVAVKVYGGSSEELAKNELAAYKALGSYPHIVPLKGIYFGARFHFVMRYVPKNLKDVLDEEETKNEESEVNWTYTLNILKQLAYAIKSAVDEDFVVGDVKPNNILIDTDGTVFLCDFGSARKGGVGIPTRNENYTPGEVKVSGKGTPKTDVYSFGVILLQMIMKINTFPTLNESLQVAVIKLQSKKAGGKKNKKAPNSSKRLKAHVSVEARVKKLNNLHAVKNKLLRSGCSVEDAKAVTDLGINCTNEVSDHRPSIEEVIVVLEELRVQKTKR